MQAAVEFQHVTVRRLDATRPALDNIHLTISQGSFCAICGHNGAGKTTFARTLVGLIPVVAGDIQAFGEPLERVSSERIQMMFQPPSAQVIGDTLFEELAITLVAQAPSQTHESRLHDIASICRQVGLNLPLHTPVSRLSGGQLARLCLAQTLASGAEVLILDEALSEIDADAKHRFLPLLRQLTDAGKTVLLITHDMEDVLHADRVLVFEEGRLATDCSTQAFFYGNGSAITTPAAVRHGFELPYLVETATRLNARMQRHLTPLSERAFMEALSYVPAN